MAQSSNTTITDGSGLQVLGSVNDRLQSLYSNNEGAGQPTNAVVGMLWFDPSVGSAGRLKICYSGSGTSAEFAVLPFDPASGNLFGSVEIANASDLSGVSDRDISSIANDGGNINTGTIGSIATSAAIRNYVDATNTHGEVADNTTNGHNLSGGRHGVASDSVIVGTKETQTLSDKTLTSPVINTGVTGSAILDEDTLATNSNTQLATQQSIKAYVDGQVGGVDLDFTTDSTGNSSVDLDSQTLSILGGTGIGITHAAQNITAAIDSTVATLAGTQILTNKTITNPTINGGTVGSTTAITSLNVDNIDLDGNTISTTDTNGDLVISPNGTGNVLVGSASGANARDLIVHGDLTVNGTTTTINSTTESIADKNIVLASNQSTLAGINGAGITLGTGTTDATNEHWQYNNTAGHWETRNKAVSATAFKVGTTPVIDTSGNWEGGNLPSASLTGTVTNIADATISTKGVASFPTAQFTVASGAVSIKDATTAAKGVSSFDSDQFTVTSGAVSIDDASVTEKGIASFDSDQFTVTTGAVSIDNASITEKGIASFPTAQFSVTDGAVAINNASGSVKGAATFNTADFTTTSGDVTISLDGVNPATQIGAGALPTDVTVSQDSLRDTVSIAKGGSGLTSVDAGNTFYGSGTNVFSELKYGTEFTITAGSPDVLSVDLSSLSNVAVTDTGASNGQHLVRSGVNAGAWSDLAVDTGDIVEGAVDFDKIQDVTGLGIIGRNTTGTGDLDFLTGAEALSVTGVPTLPSTIATDTQKNYVLKLTDVGGTESLSWNEQASAYSHPTHTARLVNADTGILTGADVVSDVDINFTSDAEGHVTIANTTVATRTLTPSDIGAASSSHSHAVGDLPVATESAQGVIQVGTGLDVTAGEVSVDISELASSFRFHIQGKTLELRSGGTTNDGTLLTSVSIADLISTLDVEDWT